MASSSSAGASGECEGEDQEDSSSSSLQNQVLEVASTLEHLDVEENSENNTTVDELSAFRLQWQRELESTPTRRQDAQPIANTEDTEQLSEEDKNKTTVDELSAFRQQWQRELESTPTRRQEAEPIANTEDTEQLSEEDKAKQLFLRAVELERGGKLYEAIQHYKRAMQILPDVETRLYDELRADSPEVESETEEEVRVDNAHPSDDEDAVEGEDLLTRLHRILARKPALCEPEIATKGAHISWLPYEVILVIVRWVVSAELDAGALERVSAVCRGLYVAARETDIWRSLCVKTWGIDCGTPRASGFGSWRQMYILRPRLHLHGCYISKATYIRHGENSFQDQFYRPWYLIEYYRYLRFFSDGVVLMWTTPDEPVQCVSQLKYRHVKPGLGIMVGHYRLIGEKVVIVLKKKTEQKPAQPSNTRFRSRRKEPEQHEQTFHMELEVRSARARRNWQLWWLRYAVCARRDQWTHFDLAHDKYPPFAFSRVRNYTAETHAPLLTTHAYT